MDLQFAVQTALDSINHLVDVDLSAMQVAMAACVGWITIWIALGVRAALVRRVMRGRIFDV